MLRGARSQASTSCSIRREAVDEAAALDERCAIAADERHGILQVLVETGDVRRRAAVREVGRTLHARPEDRIEVQRPADVVVVRALVAIGQPAALPDERVVPGQVGLDVVLRPWSADRPEEGLDHEAEPDPVRLRVGVVADHRREVVDDALLRDGVEPIPDPRAGHVEDECDGGGFDLRLRVLVETHPAVGSCGIDAGGDAS